MASVVSRRGGYSPMDEEKKGEGAESKVDETTKENATDEGSANKLSGKAWGRVWKFLSCSGPRFPASIFFIIGNEFCERFSYYGMRAVLVLYFWQFLFYDKNSATAYYHGFIVVCYCAPILGAIIADSCLGKYVTIISLSIVYAIGNAVISISAVPPIFNGNLDAERAVSFVGLLLIALGTGGIKPCVSAFGGDQFKDDQKALLSKFFSIFYFSINAGSVISTFITPIFRADVQCFGRDCFALAFGVPSVLMVISLVVFAIGTPLYHKSRPKCVKFWELVIFKFVVSTIMIVWRSVVKCVKMVLGLVSGKKTWRPSNTVFQAAEDKYGVEFVSDVKDVLYVLVMFLPLPIFWTLFDQQGSRWTLQATQMNGEIAGGFRIQPDQMQVLNALLILVFIPIFEVVVYPLFAKCKLFTRPLQRMVAGMSLAGVSFVVAALVQIYIDSTIDVVQSGFGRLSFVNPTNVSSTVYSVDGSTLNWTLGYQQFHSFQPLAVGNHTICIGQEGGGLCDEHVIAIGNEEVVDVVFTRDGQPIQVKDTFVENIQDNFTIRVVNLMEDGIELFMIEPYEGSGDLQKYSTRIANISSMGFSPYHNMRLIRYKFTINFTSDGPNRVQTGILDPEVVGHKFHSGGGYTLILTPNPDGQASFYLVEDISPNSVHLALQIPMYVLITAGEVMFSVTGLDFAYSQAPESMKAILQAAWLLTVAGGNIIVIIIAEGRFFPQQFAEFFFFAGLIFVLAIVFAIMSCAYTYRDDRKKKSPAAGDAPDQTGGENPPTPRDSESHPLLTSGDYTSDNDTRSTPDVQLSQSLASADKNVDSSF